MNIVGLIVLPYALENRRTYKSILKNTDRQTDKKKMQDMDKFFLILDKVKSCQFSLILYWRKTVYPFT